MLVELKEEDVRSLDEDWNGLTQLFPDGWEAKAYSTGAIERPLRKFKSISDLMRSLLLHTIQGYSLRETAAILKESGTVDISDVALMERLQKAGPWFQELSNDLLAENCFLYPPRLKPDINLRLFDGSVISEEGKTGSQWRLHYSFQLPSLCCDSFELTPVKGKGNGESLERYGIKENDYIIADRNYATQSGIEYIKSKNAYALVRVNTSTLPLFDAEGKRIDLLELFDQNLIESGNYGEWESYTKTKSGELIKGRLCVIKKTTEATEKCKKKIIQESKNPENIKKETLRYAEFIILFTTFPEDKFSTEEILDLYRWRWQIELAFKRLKSLLGIGHLPKHDELSSRAWISSKLFISLVIEKLTSKLERLFPPWGEIQARRY